MSRTLLVVTRCGALVFGLVLVLNLVLGAAPAFDANLWWIDLRPLDSLVSRRLLAVAGAVLMVTAACRQPGRLLSWTTRLVVLGLLLVVVSNAANCLAVQSRVQMGFPVPFSALLIPFLCALLLSRWESPVAKPFSVREWIRGGLICGTLAAVVPVAQMLCFGCSDYRRPADVVVVFGARVYADGRPSQMLADRTRSACELYRQGLVRKLVLSGGPGPGTVHETDAMRTIALREGVAERDLVIDRQGWNTHETVANTLAIADRHGYRRLLAVSHFYHLPRIKLAFEKAGRDVCTVPARQTRTPRLISWYMARETAALWAYYLTPPS